MHTCRFFPTETILTNTETLMTGQLTLAGLAHSFILFLISLILTYTPYTSSFGLIHSLSDLTYIPALITNPSSDKHLKFILYK